jgi:alpha-ketoglutarate-dependent taurine dioxygenase
MNNIIIFLSVYIVQSYKFSLPYKVNWIGQFENLDIKKDTYECLNAFKNIPILILKNQKITNDEYYNFVSLFDNSDKDKLVIQHPYKKDFLNNHVAICENIKQESIKYNNLWHMDNLGKYEIPNIVSSFYFEEVPHIGGETIFSNLLNAYSKIKPIDKIELNNLICIYENSNIDISDNIYAPNGFRRLNKIIENKTIKHPLIYYPYINYSLKSFLFSPIRFIRFEGYKEEYSWDIMDYLFYNYINTNTIAIKWEKNDLVIFNNRVLLHTTTPTQIYYNENRKYKLIFLPSKKLF